MNQFFATLPARVIAIGAIVFGLILILLNDPPRTVCDTQLEVFRKEQNRFLFGSETKGIKRKPEIETNMESCRVAAGPGGCFELFEKLKKMVIDLENVPAQCASAAGAVPEISAGVWGSLKLMVMLAWGEKPPAMYTLRNGWLDSSDIALFCGLRRQAERLFGRDKWGEFREKMPRQLPQAATMPRDQLWQRSLVSTSCDQFR